MSDAVDLQSLIHSKSQASAQRAYAFLSFAYTTPVHGEAISGPLDCLKPIVGAALAKFASRQVNISDIQKALRSEYSLDLPAFMLTKILLSLESKGLVSRSKSARDIFVVGKKEQFGDYEQYVSNTLQPSLEKIESSIKEFARDTFGQVKPIGANSWVDVLIQFLRESDAERNKISKIKEKLITNPESGKYIIARFLENAHENKISVMNDISIVYTGILVDDFVSTIQDLGDSDKFDQLHVFYDTPVLLRLMGTSGRDMQSAYTEMHNLITTLGCKTYALQRNIEESINILETIISRIDNKLEVTGETADALLNNEIGAGAIRILKDTFEGELASKGIYESKYDFSNTMPFVAHQIDEGAFINELQSKAMQKGRGYRFETAAVDAESVALICRLRRGHSTRQLSSSRFLFITSNEPRRVCRRPFSLREWTYDRQEAEISLLAGGA